MSTWGVQLGGLYWHDTPNKCCGHNPEIEVRGSRACVFCWHCDRQTDWIGGHRLAGDNMRDAVDAWNNGEFVIWEE